MKTYNNLWDEIISVENIKAAVVEAARGKRRLKSVRYAIDNIDKVADKLSRLLASGEWRPLTCHCVHTINDGIQLKKREIVCPEFIREQVVHHALMRVVAPKVFMRKMYEYCCGSVPRRGDKKATDYLNRVIANKPKETKYYVKLDIRKFFDTVRPSVVFRVLRTMIRDRKTLMLISLILRNNKIRRDDGTKVKRGVPIGFFTSPWFANIVLTPLDHWLKNEKQIGVVARFIDDIILMDSNKRKLRKACFEYKEKLMHEFKLKLKYEIQVHELDIRPFEFIGYQFSRNKTILRSPCFLRAKRSIKRIGRKTKQTTYDSERALCYVARFGRADMRGAFYKYIRPYVSVRQCRLMVSYKEKIKNEQHLMEKS